MQLERPLYPFTAVVGQEKLKLSLILNAINPRIGGVLVSGATGTGKSLGIRALGDLLPEIEVVEDCPFRCSSTDYTNMCTKCRIRYQEKTAIPVKRVRTRIVELPQGVTEDRVIGTIDAEKAIQKGIKEIYPGLLAEANQNILYVDDINLLPDHIIDCILDPAALGWNTIQREGLSLIHPSRFALIGSMNPKEGDLRPQILDRFALYVRIETLYDIKQRIEIMERNADFEKNPIKFYKKHAEKEEALRKKIVEARRLLPEVRVHPGIYEKIATICSDLHVDGHRPDIVSVKAAKTLAAFNGRTEVMTEDVFAVMELAIAHRRGGSGLNSTVTPQEIFQRMETVFGEKIPIEVVTSSDHPYLDTGPMKMKGLEDVSETSTHEIKTEKEKKRKKVPRLPRWFSYLVLPIVSFFLLYISSVFVLLIYSVFFGVPSVGKPLALPINELLPVMGLLAVVYLILFYFLRRRKPKPSPIVYYQSKGGRHTRRSAPFTLQFDQNRSPRGRGDKIVALRGTYLQRLYKALVGYGRKIGENLKIRKSKNSIKISLEERLRKVRGRMVGRRIKNVTSSERGRYVYYKFPKDHPKDIAFSPTIRAAAPYQIKRRPKHLSLQIESQDIRVKVREKRAPLTVILLLDMSGSMIDSLNNVREAVLSLHKSAYRRRDRVGLVIFKGSDATVIQHPTTNLDLVVNKLLKVGASDFTPMAAGMLKSLRILQSERRRIKEIIPILVIISDGIVNIPLKKPLSPFTRKQFFNPSQADVIDVSHLLTRNKIRTIVINPDHQSGERYIHEPRYGLSPNDLLLEIPRISGGRYYGISSKGEVQMVVLTEAMTSMPGMVSS
jgi:Mg-chelatase subunit ChlI/Mg-chelatase subunit ChlD